MKTLILGTVAAFSMTTGMAFADAHAGPNPSVGGAAMLADRNIIENAVNSPIHTTLVAAVQAADLVDTLSSAGPFTVFAPTDSAFGKVSEDSLNALLQPANKAQLQQILTCHVVAGDVGAAALIEMVEAGGGSATLQTVGGCAMTATVSGGTVTITDQNGRGGDVTIADVNQSNGVIHVIDRVLLPQQ